MQQFWDTLGPPQPVTIVIITSFHLHHGPLRSHTPPCTVCGSEGRQGHEAPGPQLGQCLPCLRVAFHTWSQGNGASPCLTGGWREVLQVTLSAQAHSKHFRGGQPR